MCNGFGAIVTANELYFCEPDTNGNISHSEILRRLGWCENSDQFIRRFVRIECDDWSMASFHFDETDTLPGWVDENDVRALVCNVLERTAPAWATYEAVRDQAWATYEAVRAQALATYEAVREAVRAQAWATYEAVRAQALATYEAVCDPAWATYEAARAQALAEMCDIFSRVPGYVSA